MTTLKPVDLKIRWHELLGNNRDEMSDDLRRERWEQWKALCLKQRGGKKKVEWWTDCAETCSGCIHRDGDWCKSEQLPCTVNPVFTFSDNTIGMACMGAGYTNTGQLEMF